MYSYLIEAAYAAVLKHYMEHMEYSSIQYNVIKNILSSSLSEEDKIKLIKLLLK